MITDEVGCAFIAKWEGKAKWDALRGKYFPYRDPVGLWTIGVGHLVKPGEDFCNGLTDAEVLDLLAKDLAKVDAAITKNLPEMSQGQHNAWASFAFNCGTGVTTTSTAARLMREGKWLQVPAAMAMWNKAGGKFNQGLATRRADEGAVFARG